MSNTSTIGQSKNGQFLITFPKAIAQAMKMKKGDKIEWIFDKGDIIIRKCQMKQQITQV